MGKLIRFKKKHPSRVSAAGSGHHTARQPVRNAGHTTGARGSRRKKGFLPFVKRNYKILALAAGALVVTAVLLIVFLGGGDAAAPDAATPDAAVPTAAVSGVASVSPEAEATYDYAGVDDDTLAGLAGTDEDLFSDADAELADALFAEEGLRIGVTIGSISSDSEELVLNRLEEAANSAEEQKIVYDVFYYIANGNYNQQIQDVRSMIKNKVDAIIAGFSDATSFNMVLSLAEQAGIPVIAFDAPVTSGYAINVTADQHTWGKVYGTFMSENLTAGNVVMMLGSQEDAADSARQSAMSSAMSANANIQTAGIYYAAWKEADAKAAMAAYLTAGQTAEGVIAEEGMAEGVLDAYIEAGVLPKVMCGDVTAGFIKKWYALKNGGIDMTPSPTPTPRPSGDTTPLPTPVMLMAQPGEMIVCAQPAPSGVGAAAFEIAVKLAEGRTLKQGEGQTYEYTVKTLLTDDNLSAYYALIKEQQDSFLLSDLITAAELEKLFGSEEAPAN